MRLIDADEMRENLLWCKSQSGRHNDIYWDDVIERLDVQPTVDAVPVKHGKWNHIGTLERYVGMSVESCSEFRCSVCDSPQTFFVPIAHYNYCPNCGAKMDIGAENDGIGTEEEADDNR